LAVLESERAILFLVAEVDGKGHSRPERRNSFVGTANYVCPELLTDKASSHCSDLWALGCILYQMVGGLPPFRSRSEYIIFQQITKVEYEFPDGFHPLARDLVEKLLVSFTVSTVNYLLGATPLNGVISYLFKVDVHIAMKGSTRASD